MEYRLEELCKIGSSKRIYLSEYTESGIPFYRGKEIIEKSNGKKISSQLFISLEKYEEIKSKFSVPKIGDILISAVGTLGKSWFVDEENFYFKDGNLIWLYDFNNEIINNRFLYYKLKSKWFENIIDGISIGSTQKAITIEQLKKVGIDVPDIKIQNKIVKILDGISIKIEVNNQINDNFYNLSQEIFKRWFIDFEFPNNDGLSYKSANGQFKEVNGEIIPVDWQINRLDEVAECQNGNAFYKDGYDETGIMVVDLGNVNINGSFVYTNADKYISQERLESNSKYNKYLLHKDDLVMVMTDRKATMDLLGKTGKIYEEKEYLLNQRMYRIRSKINVNYLYTILNSSKTLNELKSKALGSVQKYVNTGHINELKIIVGTDEIMEKFSQIVNPIFERIENNILENDSLQELRDTLLPKLMNGEINIDKIEV